MVIEIGNDETFYTQRSNLVITNSFDFTGDSDTRRKFYKRIFDLMQLRATRCRSKINSMIPFVHVVDGKVF